MNPNNRAIGSLSQNVENIDATIVSATVTVAAVNQLTQDSMEPPRCNRKKNTKKAPSKAVKTS